MGLTRFYVALLGFALSGCVTADVRSAFVTPYDRPLDAVRIVSDFDARDGAFETTLVHVLTAGLEARGITVSVQRAEPDVTDRTESSAFDATTVLTVRGESSTTGIAAPGYNNPAVGSGYGGASGMGQNSRTELSVGLTDLGIGAVVWTAGVVAKGANGDPRSEARRTGENLLEALAEDGLLSSVRE